ncbi:HEAT repeat domain-containing protein [Streptomyces sp. NPDC001056]
MPEKETTNALRAALAEAGSASWSRRARAGRDLARSAEVPEAAEALARLLLDAADTAVTRRTAEALVRAGTVDALRLLARAVPEADDNQADWLRTGMWDALAGAGGEPDAAAVAAVCARLARDPRAAVRRGAAEILAWSGDGSGCAGEGGRAGGAGDE